MKYVGSKKNKQDIATIEDIDNVQDQIDDKVNKSGDTMTGTLTVGSASLQTNGYVTGTWLKTTANIALSSIPTKIAVINDGWVYTRTPAQIKSDIGLGNVDNVKQYSADNPPPYPVTSVNGQTGAVTVELPDNLVKYQEIVDVEATPNVNADTLEGHNADYFATAASVSTLNDTVGELGNSVTANSNDIKRQDTDLQDVQVQLTELAEKNVNLSNNVNDISDRLQNLSGEVQDKLSISGGVMGGFLIAQTNTEYEARQVRNVIISTADPSGGNSGDIWLKYAN